MPLDQTAAIDVRGLRKTFGSKTVLDDISFTVPAGSIFALLGPNGAGKTTAVKLLTTLIARDGGEVLVGGYDPDTEPDRVRSRIGVTGQFSAVDGVLTGRGNMVMMARLGHLPPSGLHQKVDGLLEQFGLAEAARKPVATYSGGMKRRLDLAMTLIGDPQIIFLDEPTTGLDPRARRDLWETIRHLVSSGVTIMLTTQYLEEADQLADRVAVLHNGRLVESGTPAELKRLVPGSRIDLQFDDRQALDSAAGVFVDAARDEGAMVLEVPSDGSLTSLRGVLESLDRGQIPFSNLSIHAPDLDDVFLALTSQPVHGKDAIR